MTTIGSRTMALRAARRISQAALAKEVGIWHKLPQPLRDTLLQTARGLLRATEISPPTAAAPAPKKLSAPRKQLV